MRPACIDSIFKLAEQDERVVYLGSDLSPELAERMQREMPGRAFMEGVAEQHIIGMAAGMAMEGRIPFVHTIASFLTRRCYEQIAVDLCMHNLPVRLIGNGGGLVYSQLGPTHLAIEDMAIMRALPNMAVIAPADAYEMRQLMQQTLDWPGPIYIRVAFDTKLFAYYPWDLKIGRGTTIVSNSLSQVLLVSTGVESSQVRKAQHILAFLHINTSMIHLSTVKPLDVELLQQRRENIIVTVEEGTVIGGLGSAVADAMPGRMHYRIGIPDVFPSKYGTQEELCGVYGLQAEQIVTTVKEILGG